VNEILDLTPGLQCCLRCGRMLTDRALHDALEEPVLASIRAGRGVDSSGAGGECQPCIEEYRNFLNKRQARAAQHAEQSRAVRLPWMSRWLGRRVAAAT
jgi:bacterioferritin-associated ferredoxin